jgi:hypothetical protein
MMMSSFLTLQFSSLKSDKPSPFNFLGAMRRLGGSSTSMFSMVDQVDDMLTAGRPLSCIANAQEGKVEYYFA